MIWGKNSHFVWGFYYVC